MRSELADSLKGGGILLVVFGHVLQVLYTSSRASLEDGVYVAIYSFHMPLFALISGYYAVKSFKCRDFIPLVKNRFYRLLVPFFAWAIILFFLHKILAGEYYKALLAPLATVRAALNPSHALWFLWALFWLHVYAAGLACWRRTFVCIGLGICSASFFWDIDEYFGIRFIQWLFPFFLIGYCLSRFRIRAFPGMEFLASLVLGGLWLFLLPMYSVEHFVYMSSLFHGTPELRGLIFRYAIALLGCGFFYFVLRFIYLHAPLLLRPVESLGRNSLQIYAIHFLGLAFLPYAYKSGSLIGNAILYSSLIMYLSLLISKHGRRVSRRAYSILFGEKLA